MTSDANQGWVSQRFPYIDSLRGIAALYVVFGHALNQYHFKISSHLEIPFELLKQLTSGLAGVFLFFLISGYVIPSSFEGKGASGACQFIIRRLFRLYPLFWFSILPDILRFCFKGCADFSLTEILSNLTMVPKVFDCRFICDVFWTLAHELLFYAICVALFFFGWIGDSRKLALCTFTTAAAYWLVRWGEWMGFYAKPETFFQKTVLICMSTMFWGALWRAYQENRCKTVLEKIVLALIPLQYLLLTLLRPLYTRMEAKQNFPLSFGISIAIAFFLFIAGTTFFKLKNRWLVWCGTVSYSIYLFHMMVVSYATRWLSSPSFWAFGIAVLAGTCLAAAFGFYFVERPFMRLGKRLTKSKIFDERNVKDLPSPKSI